METPPNETYTKTAVTKSGAKDYCVYSVFTLGRLRKLNFKVSNKASRKDGALTTVTNIKNFWGAALTWDRDVSSTEFDSALVDSVVFLNAFVEVAEKTGGFKSKQHLSSMALSALGKYYRSHCDVSAEPISAPKMAEVVVGLGDIGRQKSEQTYNQIVAALKP